ncbi:hypothetical protein AGABI1DRAFT_65173, partial [Agaricus bisporus var. burnettii JB137-S8]
MSGHKHTHGFILENRVTHIRGLPVSSSHAFRYSTVSFLVGLDSLESGNLDLVSGWLFGYGGRWGRIIGLRSKPYLDTLSSASIRRKLELELRRHCLLPHNETFQDAWLMTMPSVLGFEGINPLTVYFCFKDGTLWTVVLEIHNTFNEGHIHLLCVGKNEDPIVPKGYDHQWTFPRQFHVSPFNDRRGFYTVSVAAPVHPPCVDFSEGPGSLPAVYIRLYTDPDSGPAPESNKEIPSKRLPVGELKLAAYLRATVALPLTTGNAIRMLAKRPLVLFSVMPRILYQAWILQFNKRLDVFARPEPHALDSLKQSDPSHEAVPGGGVIWQEETYFEFFARRRVIEFVTRRVYQTGISVSLISSNPNVSTTDISAPKNGARSDILRITYLSPRFFTIVFTCPSAEHVLLFGRDTEALFDVSSTDLFNIIFSPIAENYTRPSFLQETLQGFRRTCVLDT